MMIQIVTSCLAVVGSSTIIRMPRGDIRFVIDFRSTTDDNSIFPGHAIIDLEGEEYSVSSLAFNNYPRESVRGISILNDEVLLDFGHPIDVFHGSSDMMFPTLHIPASPGSAWSESCSGFLMSPLSDSEDGIIINPTDALQYAFEGQIFYSRAVENPAWPSRKWAVNSAFRVIPNSLTYNDLPPIANEDFVPCALVTGGSLDGIVLPDSVYTELLNHIQTLGISIRSSPYGVYLTYVTAERLAQLPNIETLFLSESGQQIHLFEFEPTQYLHREQTPETYRLMLERAAHRSRNNCQIQVSDLSNILIHFDTQNNRIGFGEPLVEL